MFRSLHSIHIFKSGLGIFYGAKEVNELPLFDEFQDQVCLVILTECRVFQTEETVITLSG